MPLTDKAIRALKATGKVFTVSDAGGLQLRISEAGTRTWRFAYRFEGRQKTLIMGQYPDVSLADARLRRDDARRLLLSGIDPGVKIEKVEGVTFKALADSFMRKRVAEGLAEVTRVRNQRLLDHVMPELGQLIVGEIRPADVLKPLRRLEGRNAIETARRARGLVSAVFAYGAAEGLLDTDPSAMLGRALVKAPVVHRAAVTDREGFRKVVKAVWSYGGAAETVAALRLLVLTAVRPGEARAAAWSEFDLDAGVWTIPAERTKLRRAHVTPLSKQAVDVLRGHLEFVRPGVLAFPGVRSAKVPISENTLNMSLRRLGIGGDEMCSHGFRASFSTIANESGLWSEDAIEKQLAHLDANSVRRAYLRSPFWEERVRLMEWWGELVLGMAVG
ncbi:MAG: integrase arm-type DNA-binding domain-containing protein [Ancalomicrobiaceae bacterium]|nr:integrase arm-type DNA-binding domain-containing protein [Ancalomicrobiaceae bacterium]